MQSAGFAERLDRLLRRFDELGLWPSINVAWMGFCFGWFEMRTLATSFGTVAFIGASAAQSISGLQIGQDYVCVTMKASYQNISSGKSGEWSNAPESMRLRVIPCKDARGGICSDKKLNSIYQLQVRMKSDGASENYFLEGANFGFNNGMSLANFQDGQFYYVKKGFLNDEEESRAAFTLMAECFMASD